MHMTPPTNTRARTIVIGAGQAGLAAGYHLSRRGLPFEILEAKDRVGDVWRERWDSLRLYSPARADALPGMPFPAPGHTFPTGREMGDYLEAYAATMELPIRTATRVEALDRAPDGRGFVVSAGGEQLEAGQVILANGAFQRPRVPSFASALDPSIRQLHSSAYRDPSQLGDGPVLVVGVSHSGADLAMESARSGHRTFLSGRAHGQLPVPLEGPAGRIGLRVASFAFQHVLTLRTPIGRRMAPNVRNGGLPLLRFRRGDLLGAGVEWSAARTVGVSDGRPRLADGEVLDVATVLWCTGFERDDSWIHLPVVGDDGRPLETRGVADGVPGLYFLGVLFQYAFSSMLIAGAGRDAAYVVGRVADRVAAGASAPREIARAAA
jgi:putative flavoprotein involved in K+ transport